MNNFEFIIQKSHPVVPGHFPGHPVVPGALILEYVVDCLIMHYPEIKQVVKIIHVKFLIPIVPEQSFTIKFNELGGDRMGFEVLVTGDAYVNGELKYVGLSK